jgi:hypothetical protein
MTSLIPYIEKYSDKAFIVKGSVDLYKHKLEELKGSWNNTIKGYYFPNSKKELVEELIRDISTGAVKPVAKDDKKVISYSEFLSLITRIERLELMYANLDGIAGEDIIHIRKNGKKEKEKEIIFEDDNDDREEEEKGKSLLRKKK